MERLHAKKLVQLNSFDGYDAEDIVIGLGNLFEYGKGTREPKYIQKGLTLAEDMDFKDFYIEQKEAFHFNMANGWSYLEELTKPQNHFEVSEFQSEELEQQIIHIRKALLYAEELPPDKRKSEALTNLGGLFNQIGRSSESLRYYRKALEITPRYGQTLANYGLTSLSYSRILYDAGQQAYFMKKTYDVFGESLDGDLYVHTRQEVKRMRKTIQSYYKNNELNYDYKESSFDLGESPEEIDYRKWVLNEVLFLNPLNDVTKESIAAHDVLLLPNLRSKDNKPEFFQILFNQIKQEFVTARFLYYEGHFSNSAHFSDKGNLQLDVSKGINYGMPVEKLKIAFKTAYSILDKIAYLLNDYLELGWSLTSVSFRRIWYTNEKGMGTRVMDKITDTENWAFRGLFWLNKDFYEKNTSFLSSIAPESKELASLRNYIEHKSINIISNSFELPKDDIRKSYWITRNDFEKKTMVLLQTVRAAMIYLSLGLNMEESKRANDDPVIPINPVVKNDNEKT